MRRFVCAGCLVSVFASGSVAWAQADEVAHADVDVYVNDTEWAEPPVFVASGDLIVIRTTKTVETKRGKGRCAWIEPVVNVQIGGDDEGDFESGNARVATHDGRIGLRIHNRRYVKSQTPTRVNVLVVPSALIPPATHHKTEPPSATRKGRKSSGVAIGSVVALGNGNVAQIERRMRSHHRAGIRDCYRELLQSDPKAHGRVVIRLTITAAGGVSRAAVKAFEPSLGACIKGLSRRWTFGKQATAGEQYAIPLKLEPTP